MEGVPVLGGRRPDGPPLQRALHWPGGGGGRLRAGSSAFRGVGAETRLQRRPAGRGDDGAGGRLQVRARLVPLRRHGNCVLRPPCVLCSPPAQNISQWTYGDLRWFVTGESCSRGHRWWPETGVWEAQLSGSVFLRR